MLKAPAVQAQNGTRRHRFFHHGVGAGVATRRVWRSADVLSSAAVSKRGRTGRHPKGGRVTPKGTRPHGYREPSWSAPQADDEPDLMRDVRRMLRSGEPLDLLAQVSSLLTVVDPREYGLGRREGEPPYALQQLVDMFLDVRRVETSALLAVIAELAADDDLQTARIRRELARRGDPLPEWLTRLGEADVYRAQEMVHVLGDGDNVHLAVRLAGGHELTAVVYIDHNMGTLVKDAFVVPETLDKLEAFMRAKVDDPDTEWRDLDLPDARVRITDAIERAAITVPPFETDTWPLCRPIVEWLCRRMPAGGTGYARPEWSDQDRQRLADRFFASSFGAPLDDLDHRSLLESVIWFGADYGPADPLRWSPVAVEIILDDWIPRKLVADADYLAKAPELLREFVRFCHAERGVRDELTLETLAAIDKYEPDYQRAIRSPHPQGPMALLAAIGAIDPDGPWDMGDSDVEDFGDHRSFMLELLREAAGGDEALRALDDVPLPDEAFDWTGIADDVREKVVEILTLCDGCCDELLDVEYRTACRRVLARAARGDPAVFRRKGRSDTAAAAICWIVGKDNDLFTPSGGGLLVRDLMAHFGLAQSGVSQRAETLMKAAGFDPNARRWDVRLGVPELLVSRRRRHLIELRDEYLSDD
jgi:Domain of unknown function (DUF6398)